MRGRWKYSLTPSPPPPSYYSLPSPPTHLHTLIPHLHLVVTLFSQVYALKGFCQYRHRQTDRHARMHACTHARTHAPPHTFARAQHTHTRTHARTHTHTDVIIITTTTISIWYNARYIDNMTLLIWQLKTSSDTMTSYPTVETSAETTTENVSRNIRQLKTCSEIITSYPATENVISNYNFLSNNWRRHQKLWLFIQQLKTSSETMTSYLKAENAIGNYDLFDNWHRQQKL